MHQIGQSRTILRSLESEEFKTVLGCPIWCIFDPDITGQRFGVCHFWLRELYVTLLHYPNSCSPDSFHGQCYEAGDGVCQGQVEHQIVHIGPGPDNSNSNDNQLERNYDFNLAF